MATQIIDYKDYRAYQAINYSTLAGLSNSPETLLKKDRVATKAMEMGTVVDTLLTNPTNIGEITYIDKYVLPKDDTKLGMFVRQVFPDTSDEDKKQRVYDEINAGVAKPRDNFESLCAKAEEAFKRMHLVKLFRESGIIILTEEEFVKCSELAGTFSSHPFSAYLFNKEKGVETIFQLPIAFDYKDVHMKACIDIFRIDHNTKTIYPKDIKTTRNLYDFYKSVGDYRYDLQSAIYTMAAQAYNQDLLRGEYTVAPFEFVCGSFEHPGKILKYTLKHPDMQHILEGGWVGKLGKKYKCVDQLIEDMQWYYAQAKYEYQREVYENNGTINLEL